MTPRHGHGLAPFVLALVGAALVASACGSDPVAADDDRRSAKRSVAPVVAADWCDRDVASPTRGDGVATDAAAPDRGPVDVEELGGTYRSHLALEAPPIADVEPPTGDSGEVRFDAGRDATDGGVSFTANGFHLWLELEEVPHGALTDIAVSVPLGRRRASYPFRPADPLPWLGAQVGTSASARTVGDAYDLTLGRSGASTWWLRIEPTDLPDAPDHFFGLVDEAWVCLRTDAHAPPWGTVDFELVARSLFGPVTATAQLRRDEAPVTTVFVHDAAGHEIRWVDRYVAAAASAQDAVRAVLGLDWPGADPVAFQLRPVDPLDDDPGTAEPTVVRVTTSGGAPTCLDYIVFEDGHVEGWVAGDSGACGFTEPWLEERREARMRYQELQRRAQQPDGSDE